MTTRVIRHPYRKREKRALDREYGSKPLQSSATDCSPERTARAASPRRGPIEHSIEFGEIVSDHYGQTAHSGGARVEKSQTRAGCYVSSAKQVKTNPATFFKESVDQLTEFSRNVSRPTGIAALHAASGDLGSFTTKTPRAPRAPRKGRWKGLCCRPCGRDHRRLLLAASASGFGGTGCH
jgi:hypothetical protein